MSCGCRGETVALAVLSAWSLASLITIVVWSTSPDLKGATRCRSDLRQAAVELEGQRAVWGNERTQLEHQLEEERAEQGRLRQRAILLMEELERSNATLEECRKHTVLLLWNVSSLQDELELRQRQISNLTAHIAIQEERVEFLEHNATQALLAAASCERLREAAQHKEVAALKQTEACRVHQDFLQRQLVKCKTPESQAPQTHQGVVPSPTPSKAPSTMQSPALLLLLLACGALRVLN